MIRAINTVLLLPCLLGAQAIELATVTEKALERKSRLPGEFLPYHAVPLHARVAGFVEKVDVDRGSVVKQGGLLASLSAPEMAAAVAEAEARAAALESSQAEAEAKTLAAQTTLERLKAASATPGAVAAIEVELAAKAVESAQAAVKSIEGSIRAARAAAAARKELLGYLQVTAPFDGVITERYVHPGALVGPGTSPLLRLEQTSRLRLVVAVPESEVGGIVRGARVPFRVPAYPGQAFSGVVARVPGTLDPKTRTMPVELDVANPNGVLAPGMYPEVEWPVRRPRPALLVPPTSVVTTTERTFVIRDNGGKAEWVTVSRGAPYETLVEVFGPLKGGDRIVKRASDEIREGTPLGR